MHAIFIVVNYVFTKVFLLSLRTKNEGRKPLCLKPYYLLIKIYSTSIFENLTFIFWTEVVHLTNGTRMRNLSLIYFLLGMGDGVNLRMVSHIQRNDRIPLGKQIYLTHLKTLNITINANPAIYTYSIVLIIIA